MAYTPAGTAYHGAPNPKYSCQDPEGKPLVNELIEFFKITNKELPANKEK